ncbi:hypothetical protein ACF0H5_007604 [Mactra antiquata]
MEKRRRSMSGQEARGKFVLKRMKSVELDLSGSWHFMDSTDSASCSQSASGGSDVTNPSESIDRPENYSSGKPDLKQSDTVIMASQQTEGDVIDGLQSQDMDDLDLTRSNTVTMTSQYTESEAIDGLQSQDNDDLDLTRSTTVAMTSQYTERRIIDGSQTQDMCHWESKRSDTVEMITKHSEVEKPDIERSKTIEMASHGTVSDVEEDCGESTVDKWKSTRSDTIEMTSQLSDIFEANDIELDCVDMDNNEEKRYKLLKQLSSDILKVNKTAEESFDPGHDLCGVLAYMQLVPPEIRADIASYLSTGSLEHVQLTLENIHHYYHVASNLNLRQLRESCLKFCHINNQMTILSTFEGCGCKDDIELESANGYCRSESVVSNPDCSEPPQYYVVFSKESVLDPKVKSKVKVMVIDMSERRKVYQHDVEKMRQFGDGFACCSCEDKGTPIVYVSGGEGSNHVVRKYDIILGRWEKCTKLIHGRSNHMMVTSGNGSLFVLGGTEVPCIEEYNMKSNKWSEKASLATQVVEAACIYYKEKIYVFGGRTTAGPVANVQCYDINTHRVSLLQDLPCPFEGGQVVTLNDLIYIATNQGHMICFNPKDGTSYLCTRQPIHRERFGMFVKNRRIYLVGGLLNDEDKRSRTVPQYRYNADKDLYVEKYKLCQTFPVYASCIINYEKKCGVIPFNESF